GPGAAAGYPIRHHGFWKYAREIRTASVYSGSHEGQRMMFITKKHLSRRTFLRSAGVTLALPFLESMVPAQTPLIKTAASGRTRFASIYVPHGATMYKWTPATAGKGFEMSETLAPLEKYRDRLTVVSNLFHQSAKG